MGRLPNVYFTITDGGLGILARTGTGTQATVGVCSQGEVNRIAAFSDPDQIGAAFGTGPLASAVADSFSNGASIVYAVRAKADIDGKINELKKLNGENSLTATGKPLDRYNVDVEILADGGPNEGVFRYSLDGKDTYSPRLTIPVAGEYNIPNTGIKLTFGATNAQGDAYHFTTTPPQATINSVMEAAEVLAESMMIFENVHIVGESSLSMWVAADMIAFEMEKKYRFLAITLESRYKKEGETTAQWRDALLAERAQFASTRVQVVVAHAEVVDPLTGQQVARNLGGIYRGYVSTLKVQESPGVVKRGPLKGIVKLLPEDLTDADILALDEAGFVTARHYIGLTGNYITNGRMMAEPTSDYQQEESRRVMDKACTLVYLEGLRFVKSGATEGDIKAMQAYLQSALDQMVADGEIVSGRIEIPEGQNIWSTSKIRVKIRITPVAIMREIELDLGLENPFLAAKLEG